MKCMMLQRLRLYVYTVGKFGDERGWNECYTVEDAETGMAEVVHTVGETGMSQEDAGAARRDGEREGALVADKEPREGSQIYV